MYKATLLLLIGLSISIHSCSRKHPVAPSIQQRSQHMIVFLNKSGRTDALCAGTAIGPHAILTAEHCNGGDDPDDAVEFDLSTRHYHLLSEALDGRDHVIYLLDGPAFTNYLDESELVGTKPPQPGEKVFIYGDGLGAYPPRLVRGSVDNASNSADLSDVDAGAHAVWYTLAAKHGDSGSAIYAEDGRVLGLLTYGFDAEDRESPSKRVVGFALAFSPKVIHIAHTFSIDDVEKTLGLPPLPEIA